MSTLFSRKPKASKTDTLATVSPLPHDGPKPEHAPGDYTRLADYPLIAAEKLAMAIERLDSVHARFGGELKAMDAELAHQTALAQTAAASCERMGPAIDSIGGNLRSINEITKQAGSLAADGFTNLRDAVKDVQTLIESLRARTDLMRGIEDVGRQVSEGVNLVAETAVENKLIAINAAITASKASDKVKGFKVIASEISRLSALMADRVQAVVNQASQVGKRMQTIIRNMDDSILTTQKTLGTIDQAFELLENVSGSIRDAQAMNDRMLEGNAALESENLTISSIMADIENSIDETETKTREVQGDMAAQRSTLDSMKNSMPSYMELCKDLGATADKSIVEVPKIFRMKESSIIECDPTQARMLREVHFTFIMYIRLLRYSTDKKIVPYLADTWVLLQDGRTWEFSLKKGVTFQDGSPITSRDVKFSLERLLNPELESPYANLYTVIEGSDEHLAGRARGVSGIVTPDPYTVRITLKSSFNFFLSLMALGY
ncbi:MAG TPA: ABC transporter substrate-binding protein, partial [Spirochaetales bacterium]|nr:ABC transporter substrate-binding protein [Spirochaetales bacterium]